MPEIELLPKESILDAIEGISYFVDLEGVIRAIGRSAWNQFASENGAGEGLAEKDVVGLKLLDFISGSDVQESYAAFMQQIRAEPDKKIIIPYRCDAPAERRELRLSIAGVKSRGRLVGFLFVSTMISSQNRPPLSIFDFQAVAAWTEQQAALSVLSMCSYCQRVNRGGEEHEHWVEASEYYQRGGDEAVRISHGICQECLDRIVAPQTV